MKDSLKSVRWKAVLVSGIIAGLITQIILFSLFNVAGRGIIFNPAVQSQKLIAVWMQIPPLPDYTNIFIIGVVNVLIHAFVFSIVYNGIPGRGWEKGFNFGLIVWLMTAVFFEFFVPFNLLGEPLPLVGLELLFLLIASAIEGIAISLVYDQLKKY